jgi:hypothetical protein
MGDELRRNGVAANIRIDLLGEIFATMWAHLRGDALTAALAIVAAWPVNVQAPAAAARQATVNDPQWQALNKQVTEAYGASDDKKGTMLAQAAFRLIRQMFGDQVPLTLTSLNNLATFYEAQGRHREAEPVLPGGPAGAAQGARAAPSRHGKQRLRPGGDRPGGGPVQRSRTALSGSASGARHEMFGPRHPDTLTTVSALASRRIVRPLPFIYGLCDLRK